MSESVQMGMHWIMRKYKSYTHFDFLYGRDGVPFYSSSFFQLIKMIKYEHSKEEKRWNKSQKNSKSKKRA